MGKFDSLFGTVLVIRNSIFDIRYSRKKRNFEPACGGQVMNAEYRIMNDGEVSALIFGAV
jgi:hypothetical protein